MIPFHGPLHLASLHREAVKVGSKLGDDLDQADIQYGVPLMQD